MPSIKTYFQWPSIQLWFVGVDVAEELPVEVLVCVAVASTVPLVTLIVRVAAVDVAAVAVLVVGSTPFLTWAQKLSYHV